MRTRKTIRPGGEYKTYFDLIYWHEGLEDEKFMTGKERSDVINREIQLCGYFAIVTSAKMTAEEALVLYKNRDNSEKTFRGDKSYLGAHCERVYTNESFYTKIFIGFVATIIRSRIYTLLNRKEYYFALEAWDSKQELDPLIDFLENQTVKNWRKRLDRIEKRTIKSTES